MRDVFPDQQENSFQPPSSHGERRGKDRPERETMLDRLSARMERLKKQAEQLAAAFAPKTK
jgi:hypothetical protein